MRRISAQSVIEYFVVMSIILAVILSSGIIDTIRGSFTDYFNRAVTVIVP